MRVILEAFQGRLRSDVMEWPEGSSDKVRLPMDMDSSHYFGFSGEVVVPNEPNIVVGEFMWNGKYAMVGDHRPAKIYILVGVKS